MPGELLKESNGGNADPTWTLSPGAGASLIYTWELKTLHIESAKEKS